MQDWKFELVAAPEPGARTQGHVDWGDPVVSGWDWPYVAVRGLEPGPAVLVTAGIHGSEYPAIDAAAALGIPAIIAEDGGAGEYSPEIAARMLEGCENVLRSLGALRGPVRPMPPARRFDSFVWPRSRNAGFFKPMVRVGNQVKAGTILGTINDFFGEIIETAVSEIDGQVLFLVVSPAIAHDGLICGIGATATI